MAAGDGFNKGAFGRGAVPPLDVAIAVDEVERRATKAAPPTIDRNTPTAKREDPDDAAKRLNLRDAPPSTPMSKTLRRLPLVTDPFIERVAAQLGLARRTCDRCAHWSKEAAAAAFKAFPAFATAAEVLSPSRMGAAKRGEFDEIGQPVGHADTNTTWRDVGGCPKVGMLTHKGATCDAWE
jgi:hypothetical protein